MFAFNLIFEFFQIYNGPDSSSSLIGEFCGSSFPNTPLKTTSSVMNVEFHSNEYISSQGFHMTIREVVYMCSDDQLILSYDEPSLILTSPGFPEHYRHSLDCIYKIQSPRGTRVQIDFDLDAFDLEPQIQSK
ncbi:unnamed protein product [Soboliphyme baturini]|uniref:CUB domain-containing protein n=1 Tax=Soboliphyme baturini TaxID=241478 RepID=A0A3P8DMK6_9BILA|nr:unnamed protein product [Soboliphyme baturini]